PMVRDVLAHPGKRLRPLLAFGSGAGGPPSPALVRGAGIVELVHLATLVHDDVLDGADRRHGADTPNRTHGAHAAVLFGDALFAHALVLAAEHTTPELCRIVARASREVCSGEVCQTFSRGDDALPVEAYRRHIRLKTAELFEAACRVGALLAARPAEHVEACSLFGRHLGIAYQVYDDLADLLHDVFQRGDGAGGRDQLLSGRVLHMLLDEGGEEALQFPGRLVSERSVELGHAEDPGLLGFGPLLRTEGRDHDRSIGGVLGHRDRRGGADHSRTRSGGVLGGRLLDAEERRLLGGGVGRAEQGQDEGAHERVSRGS
ncbi:MAG: polyprenyl synthetase family protein, partial [Verrucomicrobiota bacterium]